MLEIGYLGTLHVHGAGAFGTRHSPREMIRPETGVRTLRIGGMFARVKLPPGLAIRDVDVRAGYRESANTRRVRVVLGWRSRARERGILLPALSGGVFVLGGVLAAAASMAQGRPGWPCLLASGMIAPIVGLMLIPRLVHFFARSELRVDGERVVVEHRPRSWAPRVEVDVDAIERLHVAPAPRSQGLEAWNVLASLSDGSTQVLVGELASEAHAQSVCDALRVEPG